MELSIIIPVYNTDYQILKQCLESITKKEQNFLYEIIIIDDGSNSINSLKYKELIGDSKIKYIYQENKGVSSARNLGISQAKGKYIMFVDSDDWMELDGCETLYNAYLKTNADLIVSDAYTSMNGIKRTNKVFAKDFVSVVADLSKNSTLTFVPVLANTLLGMETQPNTTLSSTIL